MDGMFPQLRGWGDVPGAALPAAEVRGLSTWPRGAGVKVGPPAREREAWEVGGSWAGTGVCGLRLHRPGEQVSLFTGLRWGRGFCWVPGNSVLGFVLLHF